MRTTLNIDDELLARMSARFPPGTPKTVILEESLRRALAEPFPRVQGHFPEDVGLLIARGVIVAAQRTGIPPQSTGAPLPAGTLLRDLALDREDS